MCILFVLRAVTDRSRVSILVNLKLLKVHLVFFERKIGIQVKCLFFLGWLLEWVWKVCALLRSANQQWQCILREPDHRSDYHSGECEQAISRLSQQHSKSIIQFQVPLSVLKIFFSQCWVHACKSSNRTSVQEPQAPLHDEQNVAIHNGILFIHKDTLNNRISRKVCRTGKILY